MALNPKPTAGLGGYGRIYLLPRVVLFHVWEQNPLFCRVSQEDEHAMQMCVSHIVAQIMQTFTGSQNISTLIYIQYVYIYM